MAEGLQGVILTFFSTSSAVGKTLVSCNIASELAREGARVCLVDFDLQFGDARYYLHLMPERTAYDWQVAYKRNKKASVLDCLTEYRSRGVAFSLLSSPLKLEQAYNIEVEPMQRAVLQLREEFDYVVIDTSSTFSALNLAMLDMATLVLFLGIVDFIPTIRNMKVGHETLKSLNYDRSKIRLVLNRMGAKTRISREDVERLLDDKFYHVLPNDFRAASASLRDGVPLVLADPGAPLAVSLRNLVDRCLNRRGTVEAEAEEGGSWLKRIFR